MTYKKTLVFGVSLKTNRYSNTAVQLLTQHNISTVAYGLKHGTVANVIIDTELKKYKDINTITLYLNPKRQKNYYTYFISLEPKRVIFNPGTENTELMELLEKNNIYYEIACTLTLLTIGKY
jgi:predicted CoA-binding protein